MKTGAYLRFTASESLRSLNHMINSLTEQVKWRQTVEDNRTHLEKQLKLIDTFFGKRLDYLVNHLERDLLHLYTRNIQMAKRFKEKQFRLPTATNEEFRRLDDMFERWFLRINFTGVRRPE